MPALGRTLRHVVGGDAGSAATKDLYKRDQDTTDLMEPEILVVVPFKPETNDIRERCGGPSPPLGDHL